MEFEHRADLPLAHGLRALVADALQLGEEHLPVAVLARVGEIRVKAPAKTPEASIAGAKRAPSSLVQLMISIGALVSKPAA